MFDVESTHWWYSALYDHIYTALIENYSQNKDISILDAGCGTGGVIRFLKSKGYTGIKGFDKSPDAVFYAKSTGCDVVQCGLEDIGAVYKNEIFDVVLMCDVLYFIDKSSWTKILRQINDITRSRATVIISLPAFGAFSGIHDKAVGINERFERKDVNLLKSDQWSCMKLNYWPTLLIPIILFVRLLQKIKMKLISDVKIKSDIDHPSRLVNSILGFIMSVDKRIVNKLFASSVFVVLKKKI